MGTMDNVFCQARAIDEILLIVEEALARAGVPDSQQKAKLHRDNIEDVFHSYKDYIDTIYRECFPYCVRGRLEE